MPKTATTSVKEEIATETTVNTQPKYTLDEVRKRAKIDILLPAHFGDEDGELYEFVTVNGSTTQIKRGVVVPVNWLVFEALTNPVTGKYPRSIMAN